MMVEQEKIGGYEKPYVVQNLRKYFLEYRAEAWATFSLKYKGM